MLETILKSSQYRSHPVYINFINQEKRTFEGLGHEIDLKKFYKITKIGA